MWYSSFTDFSHYVLALKNYTAVKRSINIQVILLCWILFLEYNFKSDYDVQVEEHCLFKKILNLLVWHRLAKLCKFQMYDCIIHCLYILLCSPPQVTSPSIAIYSSLPSSTSPRPIPSVNHHTVVCVFELCFSYLTILPFYPVPTPFLCEI